MVNATLRFCAVRGATTVQADDRASVSAAVQELVEALTDANAIASGDVISAIFSATPDVRCMYPAAIARELGWTDVPMLCVSEMDVADAPLRCVRVLLHLAIPAGRRVRPIYLHGACALRPDLAGAT